MKNFHVYILTNKRNGTLYVGVTSDLRKRVYEHKSDIIGGFTKKYQIHTLVYYEIHDDHHTAFRREKRLKRWYRKWKLDLIEKDNPDWCDGSIDTPVCADSPLFPACQSVREYQNSGVMCPHMTP